MLNQLKSVEIVEIFSSRPRLFCPRHHEILGSAWLDQDPVVFAFFR